MIVDPTQSSGRVLGELIHESMSLFKLLFLIIIKKTLKQYNSGCFLKKKFHYDKKKI